MKIAAYLDDVGDTPDILSKVEYIPEAAVRWFVQFAPDLIALKRLDFPEFGGPANTTRKPSRNRSDDGVVSQRCISSAACKIESLQTEGGAAPSSSSDGTVAAAMMLPPPADDDIAAAAAATSPNRALYRFHRLWPPRSWTA